jgi:hypothetical protein
MLTYADVCSRMLTYACVLVPRSRLRARGRQEELSLRIRILTHADVCIRMLTHADAC